MGKLNWMKERYEKLALIDKKRVRAQYHAQGYQKRIAKAFNKKMKPVGVCALKSNLLACHK